MNKTIKFVLARGKTCWEKDETLVTKTLKLSFVWKETFRKKENMPVTNILSFSAIFSKSLFSQGRCNAQKGNCKYITRNFSDEIYCSLPSL